MVHQQRLGWCWDTAGDVISTFPWQPEHGLGFVASFILRLASAGHGLLVACFWPPCNQLSWRGAEDKKDRHGSHSNSSRKAENHPPYVPPKPTTTNFCSQYYQLKWSNNFGCACYLQSEQRKHCLSIEAAVEVGICLPVASNLEAVI